MIDFFDASARKIWWLCVCLFLCLGPMIGGLPFLWLMPFAYLFGGLAACFAGMIYGVLEIKYGRKLNAWLRILLGDLSGAVGCFLQSFLMTSKDKYFYWEELFKNAGLLSIFGIPAGMICALLCGRALRKNNFYEVAA